MSKQTIMEKHFRPESLPSQSNSREGHEISKFYNDICIKTETGRRTDKLETFRRVPPEAPQREAQKFSTEEMRNLIPDFLRAAQDNNVKKLQEYLNKGMDVNIKDDFEWTGLMCAACAGNYEPVQFLLSCGADSSKRDKYGKTALMIAQQRKNAAIVDLLSNYQNVRHRICSRKEASSSGEKFKEFHCEACNIWYLGTSEREHIASIPHMLNAKSTEEESRQNRGPSKRPEKKMYGLNYKIPQSNVGFQLMLKSGWDPSQGLGPEGKGPTLPIKATMKTDRHGIGLKRAPVLRTESVKEEQKTKRQKNVETARDRAKEAAFRREFI